MTSHMHESYGTALGHTRATCLQLQHETRLLVCILCLEYCNAEGCVRLYQVKIWQKDGAKWSAIHVIKLKEGATAVDFLPADSHQT